MPIYEYRCKDCGKVSEFLVGVGQSNSDIKCSFCKGKNLEKVISKSFISSAGHITGSQGGKTCCGRNQRCDTPPCSDGGGCIR
ncbi:MAG: zinc ribbon domain-containing protein [Candidatus Omnitrophota bacterium]